LPTPESIDHEIPTFRVSGYLVRDFHPSHEKGPPEWVTLSIFKSLPPLRANALKPAARRARVVCLGALLQRAGQTVGFVFPKLTLLSQGEPHVTKTTNLQMKKGPQFRATLFTFKSLAMTYNVLKAMLSITS
jgi:hypothetical protein